VSKARETKQEQGLTGHAAGDLRPQLELLADGSLHRLLLRQTLSKLDDGRVLF
jgi:hypothetical protein